MTPPKPVTNILVLLFAISIPRMVIGQHQPYFFNYQPQEQQQQQQQQPQYQYQPFTNAPPPPGNFYTPSFESHSPGGGQVPGPDLLGNFFNDGFSPAPTSPANPLIPYPTHVTTLDGSRHHLSPQSYQPVGNSIAQQTPTVSSNNLGSPFRPSPVINHHTHIVNGLPRQQFFGNNYAFFRDRHGLNLTPTLGPYLSQQNEVQTVAPNAAAPTPTPKVLVSPSVAPVQVASPPASPSKVSESKPSAAIKTLALDLPTPTTTQSAFLSRFPFNGPSTFSPATYQQQTYKPVAQATTRAPQTFPTPQPVRTSSGVSPSFQFSQYYSEKDSVNSNELVRQPLFAAEDEEVEEDDDDNYTFNNNVNNNNNYYSTQARQVPQTPTQQQQPLTSRPVTASPVPSFKSTQQPTSYNSGRTVNNVLSSSAKDEPSPVRVHMTTPIRIVFNYEQAVQALEENPGVQVVIAHTTANSNLSQEELTTTARPPTPSPVATYATTPRSVYSPTTYNYEYQTTTQRAPTNYGTYRQPVSSAYNPPVTPTYSPPVTSTYSPPVSSTYSPPVSSTYSPPVVSTYRPSVSSTYRPSVSSTYRPSVSSTYRPVVSTTPRPTFPPQPRVSPTPRFQYEFDQVVPYNLKTFQQDEGTTATALENLALELEGRYENTGRPTLISQQRPTYQTVATYATEATPTESPVKSFKRGGKKFLVIPSGGDKLYKEEEPRVVVNDLANIVVQTVQPGGHYANNHPSTFPRQTFSQYDQVPEVGQQVDEDLSEEISHLNQQLQPEYQTRPPTTTTTTTTPRPPRIQTTPQPRVRANLNVTPRLLRITTYRPPFTIQSTYRTTTTTTTTTTTPPPPPPPPVVEEIEETLPEVNNQLISESPQVITPRRRQPQKYYYNNKSREGISGAYQRYEYNGVDGPSPSSQPQQDEQQQPPKKSKGLRRRPRPRGRLIAGSPPRPVQVNPGPPGPINPIFGPEGIPPPNYFDGPLGPGVPLGALAPGGPLGPVPSGPPLPPGPGVFRVGPRGRLLRRKTRPRAQGQQPSLAPSLSASPIPSLAPSVGPSPSGLPDFAPIPQGIGSIQGPSQLPPLYSPTPFIPEDVPIVTTFRPGPPPNLLVQQNLVEENEERKQERPNTFRSRFRPPPSNRAPVSAEEGDEEAPSNQFNSEEDAPIVPQRRRFQSTSTTTERPEEEKKVVVADRANILQRQIRFNRNRKNQKN